MNERVTMPFDHLLKYCAGDYAWYPRTHCAWLLACIGKRPGAEAQFLPDFIP